MWAFLDGYASKGGYTMTFNKFLSYFYFTRGCPYSYVFQ